MAALNISCHAQAPQHRRTTPNHSGLKPRSNGRGRTPHHPAQRSLRAVGAGSSSSRNTTAYQPPPGLEWLLKLLIPQQQQDPASEQHHAAQPRQPVQPPRTSQQAAEQLQYPAVQHEAPSVQQQHQLSPIQQQPQPQHQAPAAQQQPPQVHQQPPSMSPSYHAAANGPANGLSAPMKANASDLLAGLPLDQMVRRNQAQQQLKRQLGQLNGNSSTGEAFLGTAAAASQPPTPVAPLASPAVASFAAPISTHADTATTATNSNSGSSPTAAASSLDTEESSQQAELSTVTSPEAAMALAAYQSAIAHRRMVGVAFKLRHAAEAGQRVKLVGGHKSLGMWSLEHAPELQLSNGNTWQATIKLPAGSICEYKYALLDSSGNVLALQSGNNGVLAIRANDQRLEVLDSWAGDSSGAQVVADGGTGLAWPATRESRLQAWAADMFQQLATMRQDLRQARMEVVGAQEETREARMDALRYRSQLLAKQVKLAEVETEHAMDRARLVEAETINALMKEQLAETTASLQEAIEMLAADDPSSDEDEKE